MQQRGKRHVPLAVGVCPLILTFTEMHFTRVLFCASLLLATASACFAQSGQSPTPPPKQSEPFWTWDKVTFGGNLAPYFSSNLTFINVAPTIGYRFTKRYEAGLGPVYIYYNDHYYHFSTNIYGATLYNKFYLFDFLFLYGEYNPLNGPFDPFINGRTWTHDVWVGGGLNQSVGGKGGAYIMALFNINESPYPFFRSPRISVGFAF
jgi:hypothetical protein